MGTLHTASSRFRNKDIEEAWAEGVRSALRKTRARTLSGDVRGSVYSEPLAEVHADRGDSVPLRPAGRPARGSQPRDYNSVRDEVPAYVRFLLADYWQVCTSFAKDLSPGLMAAACRGSGEVVRLCGGVPNTGEAVRELGESERG